MYNRQGKGVLERRLVAIMGCVCVCVCVDVSACVMHHVQTQIAYALHIHNATNAQLSNILYTLVYNMDIIHTMDNVSPHGYCTGMFLVLFGPLVTHILCSMLF